MQRYRPEIEELEPRFAPSVTFSKFDGQMFANGQVVGDSLLVTDAGDSITHYTPGVSSADVAAIPGAKTADVLAAMPAELARIRPDLVLVMVGTNDLFPLVTYVNGVRTWINTGTFRNEVQAIVDLCHESGAVVVLTTIPDAAGDAGREQMVPVLNQVITDVSENNNLVLWDFHAALHMLPGDGLAVDGIHPDAAGYTLRSQQRSDIQQAFQQQVQQGPPPPASGLSQEQQYLANALVLWGDH